MILLFCSVHETSIACLSVLWEGSLLLSFSHLFFFFYPSLKVLFSIRQAIPHLNLGSKDKGCHPFYRLKSQCDCDLGNTNEWIWSDLLPLGRDFFKKNASKLCISVKCGVCPLHARTAAPLPLLFLSHAGSTGGLRLFTRVLTSLVVLAHTDGKDSAGSLFVSSF